MRGIIGRQAAKPVFSYSGMAKGSTYEAWREEFCRHFCRLDAAPTTAERIECTMEISQVGSLSFGETHGSSGSFLRTRSLLSDGSDDIVLVTAIDGKIHVVDTPARHRDGINQLHRSGISKVQTMDTLGDNDGVFAIRRVVHVVRVFNADGLAFLPRRRIDLGQVISQIT